MRTAAGTIAAVACLLLDLTAIAQQPDHQTIDNRFAQGKAFSALVQLWDLSNLPARQMSEAQARLIAEGARKAAVPRKAAVLSATVTGGGSFDLSRYRGTNVLLVVAERTDPFLRKYTAYMQTLADQVPASSSFQPLLVLAEATDAQREAIRMKFDLRMPVASSSYDRLWTFMNQVPIYSGTFVVVDRNGQITFQGHVDDPSLENRLFASSPGNSNKPLAAAPIPVPSPLPSSEYMSAVCYDSHREASMAYNQGATFRAQSTRDWCNCLTSVLRPILTADERERYMRSPVIFLRDVLADPTGDKPRDWRLYTPIGSCRGR